MGKNKIELNQSIYNHENKLLFLDSLENDESREAYKSMLIQMSKYEKEVNKNFYDMASIMARNCIDTLSKTTLNAASSLLSKLVRYVFWANANNYTDNVELLGWLKSLRGSDIVSKIAMEKQYLTKDTIYNEVLSLCKNAQEKALIILLFNGVAGLELSELRFLKETDIDIENNKIFVHGYNSLKNKSFYTRKIQLTPFDIETLEEAIKEDEYVELRARKRGKGIPGYRLALLESEYIFKNTEYAKKERMSIDNDTVPRSELIKRLREFGEMINKSLTPGSLIDSGKIHELTQLNKDFKDITSDDYASVLKKYNKKVNDSNIASLKGLYKYLLENEIEVAVTQENDQD